VNDAIHMASGVRNGVRPAGLNAAVSSASFKIHYYL